MIFIPCLLFSTLFSLFAEPPGYLEPWGKGASIAQKPRPTDIPKKRNDIASKLAEVLIAFHQHVLSPTDGPRSSYRPSSSQYMMLAIRRYGFIKGYLMGCDRLLRENKDPWVYKKIIWGNVEYKHDPTDKKSIELF